MAKLYVIGIGPGGKEHLTQRAIEVLKSCDVISGYTYYIKLIEEYTKGKEIIKTGMTQEVERCRLAIREVQNGKNTCIISTGDAGLYGMAGPVYELAEDIEVEVIPGVSSVFAAAAEMGAPLMHDMCTISLSDLLTPWEVITKRVKLAAQGDFIISFYNPKSKGRKEHLSKVIELIKPYIDQDRPVALVKNAGREGNERKLVTFSTIDYDFVDMRTVVIIGNSKTFVKRGKMVTPRGYPI